MASLSLSHINKTYPWQQKYLQKPRALRAGRFVLPKRQVWPSVVVML